MTQPRVPDTQRHVPRGTSEAQRSVDTKSPGRPGSCEEQVRADPAGAQLGLTRGPRSVLGGAGGRQPVEAYEPPRPTASGRRGEGSRLQPCALDSGDPPHRPQLRLLLLSSAPHQRFPGAPVTPLHRHEGPVPRCLLSAGYSPAVTTPAGRPLSPVAARCLTRLTPPSAHAPRWPPRWAAWDSPGPRCPAEQPPPGAGGRPPQQLSVSTPC